MKKLVKCSKCGGHGFVAGFDDTGIWAIPCTVCGGAKEVEDIATVFDVIKTYSYEEMANFLANWASCAEPWMTNRDIVFSYIHSKTG